MHNRSTKLALGFALVLLGCAGAHEASSPPSNANGLTSHGVAPANDALARVAQIHGGAGPWAVAGYRMGEHALGVLGLERGSFDLEVVHFTPHEVQYSCIADGAAAATGASLGKLNLSLADAPSAETHTTYRRKSTGKTITLRPTSAFATRFTNVPREQLADAGRTVLSLRDAEIFEVVSP